MTFDPERIVNVAVQVFPLADDPHSLADQAIAAIRRSGLHHEVDAMETVTPRPSSYFFKEGRGVINISDSRQGTTIAEKVDRYRRDGG
jgi:uncharacterized protein YqgV (UPF0045/DUF77 family)